MPRSRSPRAGEAIGALKVNVPVSVGLLHLAPLWATFQVEAFKLPRWPGGGRS